MPSVFLSYSREDLPLIEPLEAQLKKHSEISIWRDQEKIYGGQKWPKVLGEAISDRDVFLLAWSKNSAASHFVEFEWCTAIALKKKIVPCLLDGTPLAPSLKTFHANTVNDTAGLLTALRQPPPADEERRAPVIRKLNDITATEEKAVLKQAKSIFAQQQWTVQGNVYQAGGDIHIHHEPSTPSVPEKPKPLVEKWQAWVGLAATILTIVTSLFVIQEKFVDTPVHSPISVPVPNGKAEVAADQPLNGTIFDEQNRRLSGVQVKLPEFNKLATTDEEGRFEFSVKAPHGQEVELVAEKHDYRTEERFASVGNTHYDFTMQRVSR